MPLTYAGRVEARMTVPAAGAAYSASCGSSPTAYVGTIPGANYYLTAAGTVGSLLTVLQQQLNDNVQGYPTTAAAMQAAVGYGAWSSGWLFNITSGNDTGVFGGVTMTAASSPTYSNAGPRSGIDLAVGFDSSADTFSVGDTFDVNATSDLVIAWVGKWGVAGNRDLIGKLSGSTGWRISAETTNLRFWVGDGVDAQVSDVATIPTGEWYVGIASIDRTANTMRMGVRTLTSLTTTLGGSGATTLIGDTSNAVSCTLGNHASVYNNGSDHQVAALYIGTGVGCGTGLNANLSTALTTFANAVSASWTVSLDTSQTGRITTSNSFWPSSVVFTSTALRDVLGYAYDFDYPQTAAQVAAALGGYGAFTAGAGYLCNEAAGNLVAIFGSPALTGSSLVYSNIGARGGTDKAIGFDAATDYADGGDVFDVSITDDLVIVWVGYQGADPAAYNSLFAKMPATGISGWTVYTYPAQGLWLRGTNGAAAEVITAPAQILPLREWYVGIAAIDRVTGKARIGVCGLRTGTVGISTEVTATAAAHSNADPFRVGASGAGNADTSAKIAAFYIASGAGVAAGLTANLSAALSNFAAYMKSQTSTTQARGIWIPDAPCTTENDPRRAPKASDKMDTMSPTGNVISLVSATFRRHRRVAWSLVTHDRVWEETASYDHGSLEWFWDETQLGGQSTWFKPGSPLQIYNYDGSRVGQDANVNGWQVVGVKNFDDLVRRNEDGYVGLWNVEIPTIVASV